jgi:hypothetical protein
VNEEERGEGSELKRSRGPVEDGGEEVLIRWTERRPRNTCYRKRSLRRGSSRARREKDRAGVEWMITTTALSM